MRRKLLWIVGLTILIGTFSFSACSMANANLTNIEAMALILTLIFDIVLAGGTALVVGYKIAMAKEEKGLGMIALVVAPIITVITTQSNILATVINSLTNQASRPLRYTHT